MNPPALDRQVVASRLRQIDETLTELRSVAGVSAASLAGDPLRRAAAERWIQGIVDLAVDVNAHVVVALSGRAPDTGRSSFGDLVSLAILPSELGTALAPSAGMRNLLVHRYGTIDLELVALGVQTTLELYPRYVAAVSRWLKGRGTE